MRIAFTRWRSGGLFNHRSPRKRLLPKKKTSSGFEFVSGLADGASAMPAKWSRPVFSFRFYEGKISRASDATDRSWSSRPTSGAAAARCACRRVARDSCAAIPRCGCVLRWSWAGPRHRYNYRIGIAYLLHRLAKEFHDHSRKRFGTLALLRVQEFKSYEAVDRCYAQQNTDVSRTFSLPDYQRARGRFLIS